MLDEIAKIAESAGIIGKIVLAFINLFRKTPEEKKENDSLSMHDKLEKEAADADKANEALKHK